MDKAYCKYSYQIGHNVPKTLDQTGHNIGHNCLNCFSFVNGKITLFVNLLKITLNHFQSCSFSFVKKLEKLLSCVKNLLKLVNFRNSCVKSTVFSFVEKSMLVLIQKLTNEFFHNFFNKLTTKLEVFF